MILYWLLSRKSLRSVLLGALFLNWLSACQRTEPVLSRPDSGVEVVSQVTESQTQPVRRQEPRGDLTRGEIQKVVSAHLSELQLCYEKLDEKERSGKFILAWTITKTGAVDRVQIKENSLPSSRGAGCLAEKLKTWVFPKPRGNGNVEVTYPFIIDWIGY